jgi:hypothetical protein
VSNDFRRFVKRLAREHGSVIFLGKHPVFGALHDVFNMVYENQSDQRSTEISYASSSLEVRADSAFCCLILMNDASKYSEVPEPFLNRFEKTTVHSRQIDGPCDKE